MEKTEEIYYCAICDRPVRGNWGVYTPEHCLCGDCLERASRPPRPVGSSLELLGRLWMWCYWLALVIFAGITVAVGIHFVSR